MSYTRVGELTARSRGQGFQIVYEGGEQVAELWRDEPESEDAVAWWKWNRYVGGRLNWSGNYHTVREALRDLEIVLRIERRRTA